MTITVSINATSSERCGIPLDAEGCTVRKVPVSRQFVETSGSSSAYAVRHQEAEAKPCAQLQHTRVP